MFLILHRKKINPANAEKNLEIIGAVDADQAQIKSVPKITFIIPVVPVFMNMVFGWDAIPALTLATLLAIFLTGNGSGWKKFSDFLNSTIKQSISDIAGLIMFLMALIMFSGAASINAPRFKPIFEAILPNSHLVLALMLGVLAPLALFRGPLHVWGAGAATAAVTLREPDYYSDVIPAATVVCPITNGCFQLILLRSWNVLGNLIT